MSDAGFLVSERDIPALLEQALGFLNTNELWQAEAILGRILDVAPQQADALQLMGVLRRMQSRPEEAEDYYRRSLAEKPDQAHVHHNLGNLLLALMRYEEAAGHQRAALKLKPNYPEAELNLGKALSELGDHRGAEKAFRKALWLRPGYLLAMQSLGGTLTDLGRPKEAETLIRQALAISKEARQTAALEHNLATAMSAQGRHEDALALFDAAQAKVPDMPLADFNRAGTLQKLGRLDEAVDHYRRALARNALDFSAHRDLNDLLYRLGRDEEFLSSYDDAEMIYPDVGQLALAKAGFQFLAERFEEARESYERAKLALPDDPDVHNGLALALSRLKEFDPALRAHEAALRLDPKSAQVWRNYAETLLRAGEPQKALHAAEEAIAADPSHQAALAIWGIALDLLGDPRGESLNDYENFVAEIELPPPEGYSDMESFNRDLNAMLGELHLGKREFLEQTLRGGTQTIDSLFGSGHDLVERLRRRIDEGVKSYIARFKEDDAHPLLKRRRPDFQYAASWSSRLHDCGYHTNHVHSKGWISSAYYVALPDCVTASEGMQGWIKFGEPHFDAGQTNPVRRAVQPKPGTLVLFPSYMWHGTIPFRSQQSRTTIAFDVVPR